MAFKRTFTAPVPDRQEGWLRHLGIDVFHGRATFIGATTVHVGDDNLEAKHVVIATGAVAAKLGIQGEEHLSTSDEFLELDTLPKRVFVGGPIRSDVWNSTLVPLCVGRRAARRPEPASLVLGGPSQRPNIKAVTLGTSMAGPSLHIEDR